MKGKKLPPLPEQWPEARGTHTHKAMDIRRETRPSQEYDFTVVLKYTT